MPRDANGNYVLPAGNPVTSQSLIEAVWANTTMPDLGTEVQDSLSRSAKGAMLAPLKIVDLQDSEPGLAFNTEPTSGLLRFGAGDIRLRVLGQDVLRAQQTSAFLRNIYSDAERVGINKSSSIQGTLHVWKASAGGVTPSGNANTLVAESDVDMGISLLASNTRSSAIYFGNNSSNVAGQIIFNNANNRFSFATNAVNAMFIDSSQRVGVGSLPQTDLDIRKISAAAGEVTATVRNDTTTGSARLAVGDSTSQDRGTFTWYGTTHASKASELWLGGDATNVPLVLKTQDTEAVRIDPTQKVGIGITRDMPAWLSSFKGVTYFFDTMAIACQDQAGPDVAYMASNLYRATDGWRLIEAGSGSYIYQFNGAIVLACTASGAAEEVVAAPDRFRVTNTGVFAYAMKSGTSQANAGAAVDEFWVDTTADNAIKLGV